MDRYESREEADAAWQAEKDYEAEQEIEASDDAKAQAESQLFIEGGENELL